MSESVEWYRASVAAAVGGFVSEEAGLTSERIVDGEIGSSILGVVDVAVLRRSLGAIAVARDMSRTSIGRICLPSDCV